jgi:hypothetical protein
MRDSAMMRQLTKMQAPSIPQNLELSERRWTQIPSEREYARFAQYTRIVLCIGNPDNRLDVVQAEFHTYKQSERSFSIRLDISRSPPQFLLQTAES